MFVIILSSLILNVWNYSNYNQVKMFFLTQNYTETSKTTFRIAYQYNASLFGIFSLSQLL